jgi:hypothetical protein
MINEYAEWAAREKRRRRMRITALRALATTRPLEDKELQELWDLMAFRYVDIKLRRLQVQYFGRPTF